MNTLFLRLVIVIKTVLLLVLLTFCAANTVGKDKVSLLKEYYNKGFEQKNTKSDYYRALFFKEFPSSFKELYAIYYWNEKSDKEAPLYNQATDHISSFFHSHQVPDSLLKKGIEICIGGHWEADAITAFQMRMRALIKKNLKKYVSILQKKNKSDIKSIWFFLLDEPEVNDSFYGEMKGIKHIDMEVYNLMNTAYKEVKKKNS